MIHNGDTGMGDTAELPIFSQDAVTTATAGVGRVRVDCGAVTNPGLLRPNNEDHYLVCRFGRYLTPLATNLDGHADTLFEEEGYGMVVADGLGGAAAGEKASELAVRAMLNLIINTPDWIISTTERDADRVLKRMAERFRMIDELLTQEALQDSQLHGMGTTMTLAANVGDSLIVTHVGDSRAYLFRAGKLHQLTHDHTVAQALVDQGVLKRTEEASVRLQHSLTKLLGGAGAQCEADMRRFGLADQDVLVLCSDGLTDMVDDAGITVILNTNEPAPKLAQALVDRALKNGGKDNVTVIVARYSFFSRPLS